MVKSLARNNDITTKQVRGKYTLEFKLETVRLVKG